MSGDATMDNAGVVDVTIETSDITNQTIIKDDIDTTTPFVFGGAYNFTSAHPESAYATIERVEDSLDLALRLAGGTMSGNINMDGNGITAGGDIIAANYISSSSYLMNLIQWNTGDSIDGNVIADGSVTPSKLNQSSKYQFNELYLNDTTEADSILVTKKYVDDGLTPYFDSYVTFDFVHGNNTTSGDNVILSLEGRDADAIYGWIFRDSSLAADQVDTILLTTTLPWGTTQCDSLVLRYITSSATTTTSAIIDMRLTVGTTSQWTYTTDEASATIERLQLDTSSDPDFNAGEQVTLQIIFEGDENAFLKVFNAYLVVSK